MNYISGRPSNFGKDQRVYTWNGTQHCVHCHRITEDGKCPHDCPYWVELGFNLETGIGHCEDCQGQIRLGAPATSDKGNSIHPEADSFTVFGINTADGLKTGLTCTPCADIRLDEDIAQGKFLYDPETDSWFSPRQFPDKTGYKIGDLDGPSGIAGHDLADLARKAEQINDTYDC